MFYDFSSGRRKLLGMLDLAEMGNWLKNWGDMLVTGKSLSPRYLAPFEGVFFLNGG
jgi:hypothetical protein